VPVIMNNDCANMIEIFSSIQGEGPFIGLRQAFLRFQNCNLDCAYCDTSNNLLSQFCMIEETPGRRDFIKMNNPIRLEVIVKLIDTWQKEWPGIHHSISLTGGEPLLNVEILRDLLPQIRKQLPIYLETNGTLPAALDSLIKHIDYVSMDIKIPSTSCQMEFWEQHRSFLKISAQKKVFVKVVVGQQTENWEIIKSCEIISSIRANIPLILQPVTLGTGDIGISPVRSLELQELASGFLHEVRVIPQTHKFLGLL
jgi:7-carboxy-7-deazaguanine synthase